MVIWFQVWTVMVIWFQIYTFMVIQLVIQYPLSNAFLKSMKT